MTKDEKILKNMKIVNEYSDQILELIYNHDQLTTSDLQATTEAIVLSVIHDVEKEE